MPILRWNTRASGWAHRLGSLTIVRTTVSAPITVALQSFTGQYTTEFGYRSAAALIAAIPSLAVFIFFQPFFIRGITTGALKG